MDSVGRPGSHSPLPEEPDNNKEEGMEVSPKPAPQTKSGMFSEGSPLHDRNISSARKRHSENRDEESAEKHLALEESTPLHDSSSAIDQYLEDSLECFRKAAEEGEYQIAYQYCQDALSWLKEHGVERPEMYNLLYNCRSGCGFVYHVKQMGIKQSDLWVSSPRYASWPVDFVRHILLDSGRITAPNCEYDLYDVLDILTVVGQSGHINNKYWYIYFHAVGDLLQLKDFIGAAPGSIGATKEAVSERPAAVIEIGKLHDQLESLHESFYLAVVNNDTVAFDQLTQSLKKYCADLGYHPHALFEAGAVIASIHFQLGRSLRGIPEKQRKKFRNRALRIMNDFGVALFGPGELQLNDLSKSVVAICNWNFPQEKAKPIVRAVLDLITERELTTVKESDLFNTCKQVRKTIRETYACTYGCLADNVQDDIDQMIDRGHLDDASDRISKLLNDKYFFPGEINAIRLQKAACLDDRLSRSSLMDDLLSKSMNWGFFGIKKTQVLLKKGLFDQALETLEQVKRAYLHKESDLGMFELEDILRLEHDIRQQMVAKGILPKELYPDPMEQEDKISELTTQLAQMKIDNRRLQRRVNARRLGHKQAVELSEQVELQKKTINEKDEELKAVQLECEELRKENQKAIKRFTELSKNTDMTKAKAEEDEVHKRKAKQYQKERDQLRSEKKEWKKELAAKDAEILKLKEQLAQIQQTTQKKTAKPKAIRPTVYADSSTLTAAGEGLYAGEFIESGTQIGEYTGERVYRLKVPATGRYVVWHKDDQGQPVFLDRDYHTVWISDPNSKRNQTQEGVDAGDMDSSKCPLRLMNHSSDFNVQIMVSMDNRIFAIAAKDIQEGHELFWNYDMERDNLFDLTENQQHAMERQDHIEPNPARYVKVDPVTGDVSLTPRAKKRASGVKKIWN